MYNELKEGYNKVVDYLQFLCFERIIVAGHALIDSVRPIENGFHVVIKGKGKYDRSSTEIIVPISSSEEWTPINNQPVQVIVGKMMNVEPLLTNESDEVFNGLFIGITPVQELSKLQLNTILGNLFVNPLNDTNKHLFESYLSGI